MQLDNKSQNSISLTIPISDLENWLAIEKQISRMYFVKELQIKSMSRKFAKVLIKYNKEYENSAQLFSQYNFSLNRDKSGKLILLYQ